MATSIGSVTGRLGLDSSEFDAGMKKSADLATASGRARERAAKAAAQAEAFQAKFAGDAVSEQSLRIIAARKEQAAASADFRQAQKLATVGYGGEDQAAKTLAATLQRLTAARAAAAAAAEVEAKASGHGISDRMAASAAVRGLESGNVGIRSVENFLTTIPGVGKALQTIFPILGATAFAGDLFEIGEKFYEMEQKAAKAKDTIAAAFQDQHEKAQVTIDDLTVQSAKLQDQIDKISGHPNNGLATALAEARKMADQLLLSLQADRKELEAIFKENSVGGIAGFFSGVATTGKQETQILKDSKDLQSGVRSANDAYIQEISKDNSPAAVKAASDRRNKAVEAAFQSQISLYDREAQRLKDEAAQSIADALSAGEAAGNVPLIDNGAKISNVEGAAKQLRDRLAMEQAQQRIGAQETQLGGLKQGKDSVAETNKADELRLKAAEAGLAQEKLLHAVSLKETFDYWEMQKASYRAGSAAYNQIVEKQAQIAVESAAKAAETIKAFRERVARQSPEDQRVPEMISRSNEEFRKGAVKDAGVRTQDVIDTNQLAIEEARNRARETEAQLTDRAGQSMTRYAAAVQLANVHAAEFAVQLESLEAIRNARAAAAAIDPSRENNRAVTAAQGAIAQAQSNRNIQAQQDAEAIYGKQTSAVVGATDALMEFSKATRDSASQAREFANRTIGTFNDQILKSLTTRDHSNEREFRNLGADTFRGVAGLGLNKIEGTALGFLGLGGSKKPAGTASDPLHVVMANAAATSAASAGISSLFKGSGSGDDGGDGGGLSGFLENVIPFVGGMATGGAISAGTMALVGEQGPELLRMGSTSGHITPNHQLNFGSGGGDMHFHVDARGSNDPAQVEATVQRAIRAAVPQIVGASVARVSDNRRRAPSIRR